MQLENIEKRQTSLSDCSSNSGNVCPERVDAVVESHVVENNRGEDGLLCDD